MIVLFTQNPIDCLASIRKMIKDRDITTWKYTIPHIGTTRFDWLGGNKGNWQNLTDDVYFTAQINKEDFESNHIAFKLHTKDGHHLGEGDYAVMHSELLQMLFAHIYEDIAVCLTYPAKNKIHKADVMDESK